MAPWPHVFDRGNNACFWTWRIMFSAHSGDLPHVLPWPQDAGVHLSPLSTWVQALRLKFSAFHQIFWDNAYL